MEETLRQLGGLLFGAIPTIVLFLILVGCYRLILHGSLENTLRERRERTEGAVAKARADIAAAESKTTQYENALREARLNLFKAQEQRRAKALQLRQEAVSQARAAAEAQVREQRQVIEADLADAKNNLQAESERLATEVIQAVLKQVGATPSPAGGAR
jgi:F-type H+-transporting ATPase subunit b